MGVCLVGGNRVGRRGFVILPVVPVLEWPRFLFWVGWDVDVKRGGEGEDLGGGGL